jgi:ubiquitin-protein ligase
MDLLRAVMIGPQGTPYHDGLFFFDAQFTASYPSAPPVCIDILMTSYLIYFHILIEIPALVLFAGGPLSFWWTSA